ncbi:hypothetical protein CSOJ01_01804 [Colletotrichum sojae]|uniref:Uncharacterized protein n=1 Tax=Colletotrichum sojae TaxID=2175907 RepID=A0A8H6JSA1_9PEZI|nr:hypothetical protein CSOJ01_01804 [Colletotrichum sojae]
MPTWMPELRTSPCWINGARTPG